MHVVDNVHFQLNGYGVFRNSDVKRWRPILPDMFVARAAKINRLRPRVPAGIRIGSMMDAISSAGAAFPLITVHRERVDKGACYIGKFVRVNRRAVTILYVAPEAEWEGEDRYDLRDITLLEFGGTYETLLARMAGKAPR